MGGTPLEPRIVPIAEADLDAVAPLVNRAFGIYSHLFTGTRTSPADYRDEAGEEARVILIEDGGRLVATAMVAPADRFLAAELHGPAGTNRAPVTAAAVDGAHPWAGAFYFGLAAVEPGLQRGGLGKLLVNTAERLARAEGFRGMALSTIREFGLVTYYEQFGYWVVNEEVYPAGHWEFLVPHHYCEMVKDL